MNSGLTEYRKEELQKFEPQAKILAANGVAQSLSFTSERKYLNSISDNSLPFFLEIPDKHRTASPEQPFWIKITQIGKPVEKSPEHCFTAIQKILTACFLPRKSQLIFLLEGKNGKYEMYLGLRSFDKSEIDLTFTENLSHFIEGVWPGMKCKEHYIQLSDFQNEVKGRYHFVDSLTGIPSMESQYKTVYPATIDALLSGMRNKDFAYMVIADPIPENEIDGVLYQCRDFNGQAESLKSFNFSENTSSSMSKTLSYSKSVQDGTNESSNRKGAWGTIGAGLMLASFLFPPAGAITTALAIANGANTIAGGNLLSEFTPTYTKGKSHSESTTEGESKGYSEQQGKSISHNIVNKQIEAVSEHLFYHSKRFETGKAIGSWRVGVYLFSDRKDNMQSASMQLKSLVSGQESIFEPIRIHHIESLLTRDIRSVTLASMAVPQIKIKSETGVYFNHPLGELFDDLRTVLTTKELSYYINFPLRSVPGISVIDSSPEFSLNEPQTRGEITIGNLLYGGSETGIKYSIPKEILSRHTLISGINGSGKTNTVLALLNVVSKELPFLVIEPAKTEYVDWAVDYNKQHPEKPIIIYMPGCRSYKDKQTREPIKISPLKLNPFEIVWLSPEQDPNVLAHIDRLKSTFGAAFPMYDILPILMEDLIYTVYQKKSSDWLNQEPEFGKTLPPTLNSMSVSVDEVIGNRQYEERIERNMKACLNTRIDSLKRGWKGEMLNTIHSTPWDELFGKPCVINLSYVGDDTDKAFFMALILQFLYEYKIACAEVGRVNFNDNGCTHLTLVEEAHRVMNKCDNPEQPQYKTAQMFSNMLSEIRAYGEGMILVDQIPTRLIPDAIKNTNTKIIHRLVSEDDVKAIAESMGLNKEQRLIIPRLLTGQCIVSTSLTTDKHWVLVDKSK